MFWRTSGSNKVNVGREEMKLQNGEADDKYSSSSDRIKNGAMVWTCSTYEKMRSFNEPMI